MTIRKYILLIIILITSCEKTDIKNCDDLQSLYSFSDFQIGVAIDMNELTNDNQYYKIAVNQFNSVTPENIFKPSYLHPIENYFDRDDYPLLFDDNYDPKPVYCKFKETL